MDRNKKRIEKEPGVHISETVCIGILLALSDGFMDAYSYMARGQVFANAQTGNILLFGIALSSGRWGRAMAYLLPVVSFAAGIFVIFCFAMGAVLGERMVLLFEKRAIILCSGLLLVTCLLLFFPQKAYNGGRRY